MTSFQMIPGPGFDAQLQAGIQREAIKKIDVRIAAKIASIRKRVGEYLAKVFNSTEVARSLRGKGSTDLPAHLGLSTGQASALADEMANIVRNSVNIVVDQTGGTIQIRAVKKDFEEFRSLPGASYVSTPSNVVVPVMDWMLFDPKIDIGQAAYDIVFKGEAGGHIDAHISQISRSGRAIMMSLKALGGGSPYVLPTILQGKAGKNFIEYAIGQEGVAAQVALIVLERIK